MNVVILGAGVQGVCAALALRDRATSVKLIDKGAECMQFASNINEGKIHLGHVYAKDESFRTARRMLESALAFGPLFDEWLGAPVDWSELRSNPFTYVVAKNSMVSAAELIEHYERLTDEYHAMTDDPRVHYLGDRPAEMWKPAAVPDQLSTTFADRAVVTPEVSIDLARFQRMVSGVVAADTTITTMYRHRVESVERAEHGFRVTGRAPDQSQWQQAADVVVNCLWDGRLTIDEQMGLLPSRGWLYRLKYRLLVELPDELRNLPSFTFVLGPYGDIVTYPAGGVAYLSWYPHCMYDSSTEVAPPASWRQHFDGSAEAAIAAIAVAQKSLHAFNEIVPGIARSRIRAINAGVIFSWGETDIDDVDSELHTRHEIGVDSHDGYFTINTGKFTSAPLFAQHLVDLLTGL